MYAILIPGGEHHYVIAALYKEACHAKERATVAVENGVWDEAYVMFMPTDFLVVRRNGPAGPFDQGS